MEKMKKLTGHEFVKFTDRGNSAIFLALSIAKKLGKKKVFIPDQGGWFSYKKYPKILGMEIEELKTDYGVIGKVSGDEVLLFTSLAGYFAEQDLERIRTEFKGIIIEDATGYIGEEKCGKYSDITIGSFGKGKPISYGYGGWISCKEDHFNLIKDELTMFKVHEKFLEEINDYIDANKLPKLLQLSKKVKEDLKDFEVLHRDRRGINVVVKYDGKVIDYCKEKNYEYVICPKYIRVNEKAISIELKRLDL